jgi:hypothetical protein
VIDKEMHGYGTRQVCKNAHPSFHSKKVLNVTVGLLQEAKDPRYEKVMGYFGIGSCEFMVLLFSFATFGAPSVGGDLLPWFSVFPMLANLKRSNDYFRAEASPCGETVVASPVSIYFVAHGIFSRS